MNSHRLMAHASMLSRLRRNSNAMMVSSSRYHPTTAAVRFLSTPPPPQQPPLLQRIFTAKRKRVLQKMAIGGAVSAVPVLLWWKWAVDQRHQKAEEVRTRVRVPNVQTIDDLMIERCRPGDVLLFDRRWEHCAAGPMAALTCLLGRKFLCWDDPHKVMNDEHKFDHVGIVVPGYIKNKGDEFDASNLLLLEATAGEGIVARPLLTRLEMSESRSVVLLPLALPGERRNDQFYEPTQSVIATEQIVRKKLQEFRDNWVKTSKDMNYQRAHSTLGLVGALAYAFGYHTQNAGPTSPAAWFVTKALTDARWPKMSQNAPSRKPNRRTFCATIDSKTRT